MTIRPRYLCSHEAFYLALGRMTVHSRPGKLHPRAMDPRVVRL